MPEQQSLFEKKDRYRYRKNTIVAVVGAGIAGLTAAKNLAEKGFFPIVFEKQDVPGGQVNWADKPPHKEQLGQIVVSLMEQLKKLDIEIKFGTTADVKMLRELNPYAVIVATGALPLRPQSVPGINQPQVLTVAELFGNSDKVKNKKTVLIGSGAAGLEVAEFLCVNGNRLTIVEMQDKIGKGVHEELYVRMMKKLAQYPISYLISHKLVSVEAASVTVEDLIYGGLKKLEADYVILTMGVCSVNALLKELSPFFDKVFAVGDALKPGRIGDAVQSAVSAVSALELPED